MARPIAKNSVFFVFFITINIFSIIAILSKPKKLFSKAKNTLFDNQMF